MKKYIFMLVLLAFAGSLQADDTEIYLGNANNNTVKPNIVFIFDTSGSMSTRVSYEEKYLEEIIKEENCKYFFGVKYDCDFIPTGEYETKTRTVSKSRLEISKNAAVDTI